MTLPSRHMVLNVWGWTRYLSVTKAPQIAGTKQFVSLIYECRIGARTRDLRLSMQAGLKGLAQAKIMKKSVILFRVLNITIWCKHVQRLELLIFFNFCAAHSPVRLDIETKFPHFLFLTWLSIIRNQEFRLYIQPNWWMRSTKIIKICSSSLCTCLHHRVILGTRNKITDFLMILAWASPFNHFTARYSFNIGQFSCVLGQRSRRVES